MLNLSEISNVANVNVTISLAELKEFFESITIAAREKELSMEEKEKEVEVVSREWAADYLDVSYCTLWRWEKEKYLIPIRKGKAVYYRKNELKEIKEGAR